MEDKRFEIFETYKEVNNRPINKAVIKMKQKFEPEWQQIYEMIATAQAIWEALDEDSYWFNIQDKDKIMDIMVMGLTSVPSKRGIMLFQEHVIEATLGEDEPRILEEDILNMKSLEEMNQYLLNNIDAILTELSILH